MSLAYLIGTVAALLPAAVLLGLTAVPGLAAALGGGVLAVAVMTLGFFFLRFTGQGMLTLSSRSMVMEWFDERRGHGA